MGPNYRTGAAWRLATFASLVPLHRLAGARLCMLAQALSRSGSMGGAPPVLLLAAPLVLVPFEQNQWARASRWVMCCQVRRCGMRVPSALGGHTAPRCQPASRRAKGLGAGAQRIPPPEELSCMRTASGHKTQSKKESRLR